MSNIKLDIPDITVVVEKGNEYLSSVTPSEIYQVLVNTGDNYNVVVDNPATITVNGSGSYLTVADFASTASYAEFAAIGNVFPFSGSAVITGSLSATQLNTSELQINAGVASVAVTASIISGVFGVSEYILPYISTVEYSGTAINYIAQRPGATRMGLILATWSGSTVVFTDVSTADVGNTSDISFTFIQSGSMFKLRVNSTGSGSGTWSVQSLFKLFPNINY